MLQKHFLLREFLLQLDIEEVEDYFLSCKEEQEIDELLITLKK